MPEPVVIVAQTCTTVINSAVVANITNTVVVSIGMRKLFNLLLCNKNCTAKQALLAFCKTLCRAGRFYTGNESFLMTVSFFNDYLVKLTANLTLIKLVALLQGH